MSSTILHSPELQRMAAKGYDLAVLSTIEESALMQAVEMRELKGLCAHPADEVRKLAHALVPNGVHLDQLYVQTLANMRGKPLQTLQRVADHLAAAATGLEQTAARATTRPVTLAQFGKIQGAIGARYAQLMQAAHTMEHSGVIPVHLKGKLSSLTDRPDGPLRAFYDKALAISASQSSDADASQLRPRHRAS